MEPVPVDAEPVREGPPLPYNFKVNPAGGFDKFWLLAHGGRQGLVCADREGTVGAGGVIISTPLRILGAGSEAPTPLETSGAVYRTCATLL